MSTSATLRLRPDATAAARALRVPEVVWERVVARAERLAEGAVAPVGARLEALARAFAEERPSAAVPEGMPRLPCPACGDACVEPRWARPSRSEPGAIELVVGACPACGHGALLSSAADARVYEDEAYFARRDEGGAGYDAYASERAYREARGAALLARVRAAHGSPATLLEVGSGFGYTRRAAEAQGIATVGLDVSPAAARAARALYGMDTFVGTLADARRTGGSGVRPFAFDVVLYQFVLEHLPDVDAELAEVRAVLAPGGALCALVPSVEAREIDVFGAYYRSFRRDHLHLFSRRSIALMLARAGFVASHLACVSGLDLLGAVLTDDERDALHESGRGPDLLVVACHAPGA